MDIQEHIKKKQEEAAKAKAEADGAATLLEDFPDLELHRNRWGTERYTSELANKQATKFDMSHNCGCCPDSPLEVWPYMEVSGVKIYSKPPVFQVGEKDWMVDDRPYPGWDSKMREKGIPDAIIEQVAKHFADAKEEAMERIEAIDA